VTALERLPSSVVLALALACGPGAATRSPVTTRADVGGQPVRLAQTPISQLELQPGIYLAPWSNGYRKRWLLLHVDSSLNAATYYSAEASEVCDIRVRGDSVGFTTNDLADWQAGLRFTFTFAGVLDADGLQGNLVVHGGSLDGRALPVRFEAYLDDKAPSAAAKRLQGLYESVARHESTGDLLGDELLLATTRRGLAAFYTDYEGVPDGPYPVQRLSVRGDTASMLVDFSGQGDAVARTVVLHAPSLQGPSRSSPGRTSDELIFLSKRATVGELFAPPLLRPCAGRRHKTSGGG
jgi:hypothetical protein